MAVGRMCGMCCILSASASTKRFYQRLIERVRIALVAAMHKLELIPETAKAHREVTPIEAFIPSFPAVLRNTG